MELSVSWKTVTACFQLKAPDSLSHFNFQSAVILQYSSLYSICVLLHTLICSLHLQMSDKCSAVKIPHFPMEVWNVVSSIRRWKYFTLCSSTTCTTAICINLLQYLWTSRGLKLNIYCKPPTDGKKSRWSLTSQFHVFRFHSSDFSTNVQTENLCWVCVCTTGNYQNKRLILLHQCTSVVDVVVKVFNL